MARKEVEESHNQKDVRYMQRHPKRDRFPVRRPSLAAAMLIAVAMILLVVLRSPWPI